MKSYEGAGWCRGTGYCRSAGNGRGADGHGGRGVGSDERKH
jgi:hypothetical protein